MTRQQLVEQIFQKQSYLCVGLDTDIAKIPKHLLSEPDPVFEFNKQIIDATKDFCVAYKINTAFYEAMGVRGWEAMEKTVYYIGEGHFRIADAKRGDIGNTSDQYAKAFFEALHFDAVTVTPYMGKDSVLPFLEYKDKWAIILGLTSNNGSRDFQKLYLQADEQLSELWNFYKESALIKPEQVQLYEKVLVSVSLWGTRENTMFVIGATQADDFINIRKIIPDHFLLVPGVGVQGGSLKEISEKAMISDCGLLVNVSRAIIYASGDNDFDVKARQAAKAYQTEMNDFLKK